MDDEPASCVRRPMLRRIGPAMAVVVVSVLASYVIPGLEWARGWKPEDPLPFWNVTRRPFSDEQTPEQREQQRRVDALAQEALANAGASQLPARPGGPRSENSAYVPDPRDLQTVEQSFELSTGTELDPFFASLALTERGQGSDTITRVVHWGDSAIGVDGIPSAIRKRLQARFGDAGHGFHVMAPPNTSYRHKGVKFSHNDRWKLCFITRKCRSDGRYGLGGTTTSSYGGGTSRFAPDPRHSSGHVSMFEIWYVGAQRGGKIRYRIDREEPVVFETGRSDGPEELEDRWRRIEVEDGPHKIRVEALGGGKTRIYGVVMERNGPGVVWDGLALVGAFTKRMLEFDPEHLRSQLEHRQPELAVFTFGGNDMIRASMPMEQYVDEYRRVIHSVKTARPEAACLIMAPLDHGIRKGSRIVSRPVVSTMVEAQRQVAQKEGCAFFDTYQAMGGEGSAGRWYSRSPRLISGDLSHVTFKGQIVIGELFYRALMEAYVNYRRRVPTPQAPPEVSP